MTAKKYRGKPVQCPRCSHEFYYERSRHGAAYALEWKALPEYAFKFLLWLLCFHARDELSKAQIIRQKEYPITPDALSGRISELYAWDLVIQHKRKVGEHYIINYSLNLDRACKVVNANGRLEGVIDKPNY